MPEIFMPRLSDTMEEGTLSQWLKKIGDQIEKGDIVAEIETDKATMELEAYDAGVLEKILVAAGETVPIGTTIALLGTGAGLEPASGKQPAVTPAPARESAAASAPTAQPNSPPHRIAAPQPPAAEPRSHGERVKASPVARATAREHSIDLSAIPGSGPGGRVVRADVEAALTAAPAPAATAATSPSPAQVAGTDDTEIPLTNIRRITARRLVESMQNAPHFYLTTIIDAEALVRLRAELNEPHATDDSPKISINDLLVKASAVALRANPAINVSWAGDKILQHSRVHVGVAVALESGLIVPVIHDTDRKTVTEISAEGKALIAKARVGKLTPDEFTGGTFTVSNLGMFGIDHFTAVINPPEAAILAVGAMAQEPVVFGKKIKVRPRIKLTLSIDHRALDGATGSRFLAHLKNLLEEPLRILA